MKLLWFGLLLVGLVAGRGHDDDDSPFGGRLSRLGGIISPRLGANVLRIIQIEKHIEKLRERLEEAEHVDAERFIEDIDSRISDLEGSHCEEREFQCGGDDGHECIHDLFVCDGHDDCHNHHDESDEVCSLAPIKAGHVLTGMVHWESCLARDDHVIHVTLTQTRRFKAFSSRVLVNAVVESVYDDDQGHEVRKTYEYIGGYNFAHRRLVLRPDGDQDLSYDLVLNCEFSDDERADCKLEIEGSRNLCANVHLVREDHEDDDDDDDDDHHDGRHGYYDTTHHEDHKKDDDDHHDKHDKHDDDKHHGKHDDDDDKHHGKHDDDDKHHGHH